MYMIHVYMQCIRVVLSVMVIIYTYTCTLILYTMYYTLNFSYYVVEVDGHNNAQ